jgi:hypothetical protein
MQHPGAVHIDDGRNDDSKRARDIRSTKAAEARDYAQRKARDLEMVAEYEARNGDYAAARQSLAIGRAGVQNVAAGVQAFDAFRRAIPTPAGDDE